MEILRLGGKCFAHRFASPKIYNAEKMHNFSRCSLNSVKSLWPSAWSGKPKFQEGWYPLMIGSQNIQEACWSSTLEFVSGWSPNVHLCWVNLSTMQCRPLALYSDSRIPLPTSHMHRSHLSVVSLEPMFPLVYLELEYRIHIISHFISSRFAGVATLFTKRNSQWHVYRTAMQNCWGILLITASLKFATNTAQEAFLHCVCVQCCPCGPCIFLFHMPQKIQLDWLFCCFLSGCLGQEADVRMGCWGCQRCQRKECVYFMLRWYWVIKPTCSWKTLAKWRMNQKVPLFQQSWKWKMAPLETKLTLQGHIFHFHDLREDYGCVTQPHARGTVFFSDFQPSLSCVDVSSWKGFCEIQVGFLWFILMDSKPS